MLALLACAELLGMALWFTGSAAGPALARAWDLTAAQTGWLTTAVQLGFVAGTATSAVLNLADVRLGRECAINAHPPIGSRAELRAFAAEAFGMAQVQAQLGLTYAEIGDDAGLHYAARKLAAYTRAVIATVADLESTKTDADASRP